MELIRSFGPLGFPWINLSLTQSNFLPLIQIIDIFGNEIIGFIILLINVLIFLTFKKSHKKKNIINYSSNNLFSNIFIWFSQNRLL